MQGREEGVRVGAGLCWAPPWLTASQDLQRRGTGPVPPSCARRRAGKVGFKGPRRPQTQKTRVANGNVPGARGSEVPSACHSVAHSPGARVEVCLNQDPAR